MKLSKQKAAEALKLVTAALREAEDIQESALQTDENQKFMAEKHEILILNESVSWMIRLRHLLMRFATEADE